MRLLPFGLLAIPAVLMSAQAHGQAKPIYNDQSITVLQGVAYGSLHSVATPVDDAHGLPTRSITQAATSTALTGTSSAAQVVGPFVPQLGRAITVALSVATWPSGTAQLLRSTDGGTTKLPLTPAGVLMGTYTQQGVDQPWLETEADATFYLSLPAAGIRYRVSQ